MQHDGSRFPEQWISLSGMNWMTGITRKFDGSAFGDYWSSHWRLVALFEKFIQVGVLKWRCQRNDFRYNVR